MGSIINKSSIISLLLFGLTLLVIISGIFQIPPSAPDSEYSMDKIFYYSVYFIFLYTGAYLINTFFRKLLWGRLFKINAASKSIGVLDNFITALIFVITTGIMVFSIFKQPLSGTWLVILSVLLLLVTLLFPKFAKMFSTALISSNHPFKVGDWIRLIYKSGSNYIIGEVIEFNRLAIKLRTENDTLIIFPNILLDSFVIENYRGIKEESKYGFTICLNSSIQIERAKRILLSSVMQVMLKLNLQKSKKVSVIVKNISIDTIEYEISFWISPWKEISPDDIKDLALTNIQNYFRIAGIESNNNEDANSYLKNVELFCSLNKGNFEKLYETGKTNFYKEGATIIKQYDNGNSMYILVEGLLTVFVQNETSSEDDIKVGMIAPGEYFGEMSLLTGEKRSATVIAETDSLVFEITKESFKAILECRRELICEISKTIAERQNINTAKLEEFRNKKDSFIEKLISKIKTYFEL